MPFSDPELSLQHMLESITHIEKFTAGMDFAAYQADLKTKSATERQILVIPEAASRLGDQAQVLAPEVDWRSILCMGNRLRHGYAFVNDEMIWRTIHSDLSPLKIAVSAALLRITDQGMDKE